MSDIELVVKVDKRNIDFVRKNYKSTGYNFIPLNIQTSLISAILNGKPLGKGHGRLIDELDLDLFAPGLGTDEKER